MLSFQLPAPNLPQIELFNESLNAPDLPLAFILEHDCTLTEAKRNEKLKKILSEHLIDLVRILTELPDSNSESNRKQIFIASELLKQDEVLDFFPDRIAAVRPLFDILHRDPPLDTTQAGYCCQVIQSLVNRHHGIVMELLRGDSDYISALMRHIGVRPVAELYLTLIADDLGNSDEAVKGRLALFKSLLFTIDSGKQPVELANLGYVALEVVKRSAEIHGWTLLASVILYRETLEHFEAIISSSHALASEKVALVLRQLFEYSDLETLMDSLEMTLIAVRSDSFEELPSINSRSFDDLPEMTTPTNCQSTALSGICKIVKTAVSTLKAQPELPPIPTTFGFSQPSFGPTRLSLIELLNSAIKTDHESLLRTVGETDYIEQVTRFFVAYPWHSGLHHAYENLVRIVVEGSSSELKEALFVKAGLITVLRDLVSCSGAKLRMGYFGHVTRIGNALAKIATVSPRVQTYLYHPDWNSFVRDYLTPQNAKEESSQIVPSGPVHVQTLQLEDEMDDDPDFRPAPSMHAAPVPLVHPSMSSDHAMEFEQGSDEFNDSQYWKQVMSTEPLKELE